MGKPTKKRRVIRPEHKELYELYIIQKLSTTKLAKYYNTSTPTIRKWLKEYNIPKRTHKESMKNYVQQTYDTSIPAKEDLEQLYKNRTIKELSEYYNVSTGKIYKWFKALEIPTKSQSEASLIGQQKAFEKKRLISKEDFEKLYDKYGSLSSLQLHTGMGKKTVERIMRYHGIETKIPWRSTEEQDLLEYCQQLRPDVTWLSNDKTLIAPFEIDIYSPELNFAIEYNGLYWHSQYYGNKPPSYHQMKKVKAQQNGAHLITIFPTDDMDKVKRLIRHKITKPEQKIYARNTKVIEITGKMAKEYHDTYHIHNFFPSKVHLALIHDNTIVQILSMSHTRYNQKYQWECSRNTIGEIAVVGGTSKLMKHFIRQYEPKSIITYSDLRFGDGDVYYKCGFKRQKNTKPNYWYFFNPYPIKLYSRIKFQKHKLKGLYENGTLEKYDPTLSEWENMIANKYDRVHDCGNAVWVWNK